MASLRRDRSDQAVVRKRWSTDESYVEVQPAVEDTPVAQIVRAKSQVVGRLPRAKGSEPESLQYTLWMETMGIRLRVAREKAGLTQLQVGRLLGSSEGETQGYISRIEAGKINVTARTVVRLAEIVSLSLHELLCPPFET